MANFVSKHTGAQIEAALDKAAALDFVYVSDELIGGKVYRVFWKIKPIAADQEHAIEGNQVYGAAFHPDTGEQMVVYSDRGVKSIQKASEINTITTTEVENLFN